MVVYPGTSESDVFRLAREGSFEHRIWEADLSRSIAGFPADEAAIIDMVHRGDRDLAYYSTEAAMIHIDR